MLSLHRQHGFHGLHGQSFWFFVARLIVDFGVGFPVFVCFRSQESVAPRIAEHSKLLHHGLENLPEFAEGTWTVP